MLFVCKAFKTTLYEQTQRKQHSELWVSLAFLVFIDLPIYGITNEPKGNLIGIRDSLISYVLSLLSGLYKGMVKADLKGNESEN